MGLAVLTGTPPGNRPRSKDEGLRFFSYFAIETLKMEPSEWGRITQLLTQLRHELQENDDSESLRDVILGYIRLILEYCAKQMAYSPRYLGDVIHKSTGGSSSP